jgi:hypothetical protein
VNAPSVTQRVNANVHLRVVVSVRIPADQLKAHYPKNRRGVKVLWGINDVQ